jgi:hypothetical protein
MYTKDDIYEIYRFLILHIVGAHEIPDVKKAYYERIRNNLNLSEVAYDDIIKISSVEDLIQFKVLAYALKFKYAACPSSVAMQIIKDPKIFINDFSSSILN